VQARMRFRATRGRVALAGLMAAGVLGLLVYLAACTADMRPYEAALDSLAVPADWSLVHVEVREPGGRDNGVDASRPSNDIDCALILTNCPSIHRYYLAGGAPAALLADARRMLAAAGLPETQLSGPACDMPSGAPACLVLSDGGGRRVGVAVLYPGDSGGVALPADGRSPVIVWVESPH
jgi:hypothetical protein